MMHAQSGCLLHELATSFACTSVQANGCTSCCSSTASDAGQSVVRGGRAPAPQTPCPRSTGRPWAEGGLGLVLEEGVVQHLQTQSDHLSACWIQTSSTLDCPRQ